MRCSDIIEKLETLSPVSFAEDWDNVGLLIGRRKKEVVNVMLAVDATQSVIEQAVYGKADMLITHHPLLFSPMKRITGEDFIGRRALLLCQNDISYYAMHTNFDVMGMADAVADEFELKKREVLEISFEDEIAKEGIGRIGMLPQIMSLEECALYCKKVFQLQEVRVYGDKTSMIERAAIVPGSGKDYISLSVEKQADVLITGDISHHNGIDAMEQGISVIDAGHFGLEKAFVPYMKEVIRREMPQLKVIEAKEADPFWVC